MRWLVILAFSLSGGSGAGNILRDFGMARPFYGLVALGVAILFGWWGSRHIQCIEENP